MKELLSLSILPLMLSLLGYQVGVVLQKRFRSALFNPILIDVFLVLMFLGATGMPLETYQSGMKSIAWLLTPATVCLAIPMYEQYQILKKSVPAMLIGITAGSLTSIAMVWGMCILFGFSTELTVTMLPKSVTTAIGVPLAEMAGGMGSICTAMIIITGVLGSVFGEAMCKLFRLTDPVARGVAFGTASHVVGTAKASELDPLTGAVSSLSLASAGLLTAVILPFLFPYV